MNVRNYVKQYRKKNKITQTDLAKKVGVSRQSIYAIESEKSEPSLELAFRLSEVLKVDLTVLFVWKGSESKPDEAIPPFSIF